MKYILIITLFFTLNVNAQFETIDVNKLLNSSNISISKFDSSGVAKGYFKERDLIFYLKINRDVDYKFLKLTITSFNLPLDTWVNNCSHQQYLEMLFSEMISILKDFHVNDDIIQTLKESIAKTNYDFNDKTGDIVLITGDENYSEISVEVNHFDYYSLLYEILIKK